MIKLDILAKKKRMESLGVQSATNSLINLMREFGNEDYEVSVDGNFDKADIIIATSMNSSIYKKLKKKISVAIVHFLPDMLDDIFSSPKFVIEKKKKELLDFYQKADELVIMNPYYVDKLVSMGFNKEKIHYIPNSVSSKSFYPMSVSEKLSARRQFMIPENTFVVMGCGQTQAKRGIRDFLAVAEDNPEMLFIWAGGFVFGKNTIGFKEMKELIATAPPNVKFLGIVPNEDMNKVYNCADAFIMPSYEELFPMSILEAANVNLPIIIRNLEFYTPIIRDKAIRGNKNVEFSNALKELIKDPILRVEKGILANELAEMYTYEKVYSQWDALLKSLYEKHGGLAK